MGSPATLGGTVSSESPSVTRGTFASHGRPTARRMSAARRDRMFVRPRACSSSPDTTTEPPASGGRRSRNNRTAPRHRGETTTQLAVGPMRRRRGSNRRSPQLVMMPAGQRKVRGGQRPRMPIRLEAGDHRRRKRRVDRRRPRPRGRPGPARCPSRRSSRTPGCRCGACSGAPFCCATAPTTRPSGWSCRHSAAPRATCWSAAGCHLPGRAAGDRTPAVGDRARDRSTPRRAGGAARGRSRSSRRPLRVARSWDFHGGAYVAPKSRAGVRWVGLPAWLVELLTEHLLELRRQGEALVFGATPTAPFEPNTVKGRPGGRGARPGWSRSRCTAAGTPTRRSRWPPAPSPTRSRRRSATPPWGPRWTSTGTRSRAPSATCPRCSMISSRRPAGGPTPAILPAPGPLCRGLRHRRGAAEDIVLLSGRRRYSTGGSVAGSFGYPTLSAPDAAVRNSGSDGSVCLTGVRVVPMTT